MSSRELSPEWVLSSFIPPIAAPQHEIIKNMEAYLFGAFHHRFNRALKKERRRLQTIHHLPSSRDLERLRQAHDSKAVRDLEQSIQLKEAVRNMDEWTRKVWAARQYGYSWKEIATQLGLTEPQAKLRFRYAIGKLRARLGGAT